MKQFMIFLTSLMVAASAFALEQTPATEKEVQAILNALKSPQNMTAVMLKKTLGSSLSKLTSQSVVAEKTTFAGSDHFQIEIKLQPKDSDQEGTMITGEVLIRDDKAYVFNFNVERLLKLQKFPGVSMGNN